MSKEMNEAASRAMNRLTEEELQASLAQLPGWRLDQGKLVRDWSFPDFVEAMKFVNQVALVAEVAGHHPDMDIRYNRVRLALVSHDAGGITKRDLELALKLRPSETA